MRGSVSSVPAHAPFHGYVDDEVRSYTVTPPTVWLVKFAVTQVAIADDVLDVLPPPGPKPPLMK